MIGDTVTVTGWLPLFLVKLGDTVTVTVTGWLSSFLVMLVDTLTVTVKGGLSYWLVMLYDTVSFVFLTMCVDPCLLLGVRVLT